jgi:prepilin-type N-terminal cleavage/methylation domain-containing protein
MSSVIKSRRDAGFTLIELMLAMTFISILLLTIALTIVQIATIYNHGMISKEVNVTSRAISTELESALTSSNTFSLNAADHKYVENAQGGRLCVGDYSYIWNYASALSPVGTYPNPIPSPTRSIYTSTQANLSANVVKIGSSATRYEISLVKAPDASGSYCIPTSTTASGYPNVNPVGATELLRTGDYGIVLYDLEVASSSTATDALSGQQLYKITFVLGTPDANAVTGTYANTVCKAPDVSGSDTDYCSVNRFTLVVDVVNGVN